MKKLLVLLLMGLGVLASAQTVTFADTNFRNALVNTMCVDVNGDGDVDDDVDTNNDGIIQLSEALAVQRLNVLGAGIQSMSGLENFTNLVKLECGYNEIQSLDLHLLTNLQYLDCPENGMTSLNIQGLSNLKTLICNTNLYPSLNLLGLNALEFLDCTYNPLTSINVLNLSKLRSFYCQGIQLSSLSLQGLDSLFELKCDFNQLTSLDVQGLNRLAILSCTHNLLTSSTLHLAPNLWQLFCDYNPLQSLNLQGLNHLQLLTCDSTLLTSLNLHGLPQLTDVNCEHNSLTALDLSDIHGLTNISCAYNQLTEINLSGTFGLSSILCNNNLLTSLDFSDCINSNFVICDANNLVMLNLRNNSIEMVSITNNPTLAYICCDDSQIEDMQSLIDSSGSLNCNIGSYCSFDPGGLSYNIQGQTRVDIDNNGCNATDLSYPNLKLSINNGVNSGLFITDTSGHFNLPLQAGNYVIKPFFENPSYYTVDSLVVTLPETTNPFIHDFCIVPNGVHHDLEITIVPLMPARPGFDATYKIICKNKGNQIETGTFTFDFNESVLDFVSANQTPTSQEAGELTWSFSALTPMQTRVVLLTLNCNSPSETPALNVNDSLSFVATIQGAFSDETTVDNTFILPQIVVGSYDPNDKTCLEGDRIASSMVGNYIHYLIRFENTGTWAAQNIVVKDVIDTSMFVVSSLQVTDASHPCYTRFIQGNQVEFIFENIQLPFDDAHNDGYIAFKIKTNPNLTINDSIKNMADIYFDYNLPIVTNEAQTVVQSLITALSEPKISSRNIQLYPNPARKQVSVKGALDIAFAIIYDMQGSELLRTENTFNSSEMIINTSRISKGVYVVKLVRSDLTVGKVEKLVIE